MLGLFVFSAYSRDRFTCMRRISTRRVRIKHAKCDHVLSLNCCFLEIIKMDYDLLTDAS